MATAPAMSITSAGISGEGSGPCAAGEAAARVCLDILRGAAQLAQPYAFHLCKLLREEGREGELPWVEALSGCLAEVVAAARGGGDPSQVQGQVRVQGDSQEG
jgi:hypothetical protein